jgi:hypothetical protein
MTPGTILSVDPGAHTALEAAAATLLNPGSGSL